MPTSKEGPPLSTDTNMAAPRTTLSPPEEGKSPLNQVQAAGRATLREGRGLMQSEKKEEYTIVGTDVESLFPSLKDSESARIVREAIENSEMKFENIDVEASLQYLLVVGGKDHIEEIGFSRIAPRWLGKRPDLLTVGGEAIEEKNKWSKLKRELREAEIRLVVARVVETAVLVCMSSHVYSFAKYRGAYRYEIHSKPGKCRNEAMG